MLKSANQMSTMNSACTVLKSAFGSPTFLCFLYDSNTSKVDVPIADFPPLFRPMPNSVLNSAYSEVGIGFADFPLFILKCQIQLKVDICTEVDNGFADFLIHLHSNRQKVSEKF